MLLSDPTRFQWSHESGSTQGIDAHDESTGESTYESNSLKWDSGHASGLPSRGACSAIGYRDGAAGNLAGAGRDANPCFLRRPEWATVRCGFGIARYNSAALTGSRAMLCSMRSI